jgi:hypothetical protein
VAAPSEAWTVFARSNTRIVGSNPMQGMDVCLRLFSVCIGRGLAMGWSPIWGVLPSALGLRNWSETKSFTDALRSKVWATTKERESLLWCFLIQNPRICYQKLFRHSDTIQEWIKAFRDIV